LDLLPYRRRLFGRCHDLRRKKAAGASEVRARGALRISPRLSSPRQHKHSINHAGKETNTLRRGPDSTPARFRGGAAPGFGFADTLPIFATATDAGAWCSHKLLM
jgi:hypothetical protein